jgi:hypothetical protein
MENLVCNILLLLTFLRSGRPIIVAATGSHEPAIVNFILYSFQRLGSVALLPDDSHPIPPPPPRGAGLRCPTAEDDAVPDRREQNDGVSFTSDTHPISCRTQTSRHVLHANRPGHMRRRHDPAAGNAVPSAKLRRPAILHYASWAAAFPMSQVVRLPFETSRAPKPRLDWRSRAFTYRYE